MFRTKLILEIKGIALYSANFTVILKILMTSD